MTDITPLLDRQYSPNAPTVQGTAEATNLVLPPIRVIDRLRHFPPNLYDLGPNTHLYRLMAVLLGDSGVGGVRKRMMFARLQQTLQGSSFIDLDRFYGALFSVRRRHLETLTVDPSLLATAEDWAEQYRRDASYRSRVQQFSRAISFGGSPTGMELIAEALLSVDCDIYESWFIVDRQTRTWGDVELAVGTWGGAEMFRLGDLESVTIPDASPDNRYNFTVRPRREITLEEKYDVLRVIRQLKPVFARCLVDPDGIALHHDAVIAAVNADSEYWDIRSEVTPEEQVVALYPNASDAGTPVGSLMPPFSEYQGELWSYNADITGIIGYSEHPGPPPEVIAGSDRTRVYYIKDPATLETAYIDYTPGQAVEASQSASAGRSVSDGIITIHPYDRLPSTVTGTEGSVYSITGTADLTSDGVPVTNSLLTAQADLITTPEITTRMWCTESRLRTSNVNSIVELRYPTNRVINHFDLEVSRFPHVLAIEVFDNSTGAWVRVFNTTVLDSIPAMLRPGNIPHTPQHPQHTDPHHWVRIREKTAPINTGRVRFMMTRTPMGTAPVDPQGTATSYSLAIRGINVGYQITERSDVPLQSNPIATTRDVVGSVKTMYLHEEHAADLLLGGQWRCEPQPISNAVVNLYLDTRVNDEGQLIDRFYFDPLYTGCHMSIYWTNETPTTGGRAWPPTATTKRMEELIPGSKTIPSSFPSPTDIVSPSAIQGTVVPVTDGILFGDGGPAYIDIPLDNIDFAPIDQGDWWMAYKIRLNPNWYSDNDVTIATIGSAQLVLRGSGSVDFVVGNWTVSASLGGPPPPGATIIAGVGRDSGLGIRAVFAKIIDPIPPPPLSNPAETDPDYPAWYRNDLRWTITATNSVTESATFHLGPHPQDKLSGGFVLGGTSGPATFHLGPHRQDRLSGGFVLGGFGAQLYSAGKPHDDPAVFAPLDPEVSTLRLGDENLPAQYTLLAMLAKQHRSFIDWIPIPDSQAVLSFTVDGETVKSSGLWNEMQLVEMSNFAADFLAEHEPSYADASVTPADAVAYQPSLFYPLLLDNSVLRFHAKLMTSENYWGFVGGLLDPSESAIWHPIPRDYELQKGFAYVPPTKAKYWKFEFTNLSAQPYESYQPIIRTVQTFPAGIASDPAAAWLSASDPNRTAGAQSQMTLLSQYNNYRFTDTYYQDPPLLNGRTPTTAAYVENVALSSNLSAQSSLWGMRPIGQGAAAPRFVEDGTHSYQVETLQHSTKMAFFVGLQEVKAYRIDYTADDDTQQYRELFFDMDNFDEAEEPTNFQQDPNRLYTSGDGTGLPAHARSKVFLSYHNMTAMAFATNQNDPVEIVPDDEFRDPALINSNFDNLGEWHSVGDAALGYSSMRTLIFLQRAPAGIVTPSIFGLSDLGVEQPPLHPTFDLDIQAQAGPEDIGLQGGLESPLVAISPEGRIHAAVRFTAPATLTKPFVLEIVTADGSVLASKEIQAQAGHTVEATVSYIINSYIPKYHHIDSPFIPPRTMVDLVPRPTNEPDPLTVAPDAPPPVETLDDQVRVRIMQYGPTTDAIQIDALSLFDESIVWKFSNDGGDTWLPAYGIRNFVDGALNFPRPGNQFRWQVTAYRPNMNVTSLQVRPLYQNRLNLRTRVPYRGPNVSVYDHEPPIWDDPEFSTWSSPVPRTWFLAGKPFFKLPIDAAIPANEFSLHYGRAVTEDISAIFDNVARQADTIRFGYDYLDNTKLPQEQLEVLPEVTDASVRTGDFHRDGEEALQDVTDHARAFVIPFEIDPINKPPTSSPTG